MSKQKEHIQDRNKTMQRESKRIFLTFLMLATLGCMSLIILGGQAIDIFSMRPSEGSVFFGLWGASTAFASVVAVCMAVFTLIFIVGAASSFLEMRLRKKLYEAELRSKDVMVDSK